MGTQLSPSDRDHKVGVEDQQFAQSMDLLVAGSVSASTSTPLAAMICKRACKIRNLAASCLSANDGSSTSLITLAVYKNGAAVSGATLSMTAPSSTGQVSGSRGMDVTCVAGDVIDLRVSAVPTGGDAAASDLMARLDAVANFA